MRNEDDNKIKSWHKWFYWSLWGLALMLGLMRLIGWIERNVHDGREFKGRFKWITKILS